MLEIRDISFKYQSKNVLHGLNFDIKKHRIIGLIGGSGSGKTTLLKIIAGLLQPAEGVILLNGDQVLGPNEKLVAGDDVIKLVAQDFDLKQFVKANSNLHQQGTGQEDKQTISLKRKLSLNLEHHQQTHETSGGQKQRLAIGRAIYQKPIALLLDEPFSNLDYPLKQKIKTLLVQKWKTDYMILVAHDPSDIMEMCDDLIVLKNGKITQSGSTNQVFQKPKSRYVAELLGAINIIPNQTVTQLGLPISKPKAKNQLIRPNTLCISTEGITFQVEGCRYNGKCYEIKAKNEQEDFMILLYSQQSYVVNEYLKVGKSTSPKVI